MDGVATVVVNGAPADVTWSDDNGVLLVQEGVSGEATLTDLGSGSYFVRVGSTGVCGDLEASFSIDAPFELEAMGTVENARCAESMDGSVDLLVMGGTAPFEYLWNDADNSTSEDLLAGAGTYTVTVTDAHGCTWTSGNYTIESDGPVAEFSADNTTVLVNDPVEFTNDFVEGTSYWEFGDGAISDEQSPNHSWSAPGVYTVTLTIDDGTCMASTTTDITVEVSTSVTTIAAGSNRAWATVHGIVIEHVYPANAPVMMELLDATGRTFMQRRLNTTRTTVPSEGLATGVWFVRLTYGSDAAIMRVPVIH